MREVPASHRRNLLTLAVILASPIFAASLLTAYASSGQTYRSPIASSTVVASPYLWSLIGNTGANLPAERNAGIQARVLRVSWRDYMPTENHPNTAYVWSKRAEIRRLRQAGFQIIVDLGLQDPPPWVHQNYPNSYYVNQFGERYYGDGSIDNGDANLVFNPTLRSVAQSYLRRLFSDLGTDFAAVRLGGGHWGELTYPPNRYRASANNYWAFDSNALARSPVQGWIPGESSPSHQARDFLNWYLDSLVGFQNWQITTVRKSYSGPIMMLYPSWGIRPGQVEEAVVGNLSGITSAEINGEVQRGYDFARQIGAISDPGVIITDTWLDAASSGDATGDQRSWSPIKFLASLAGQHQPSLRLYGENTGHGDASAMRAAAAQMKRYNLLGMAWYREEELLSGRYATLEDYRSTIAASMSH